MKQKGLRSKLSKKYKITADSKHNYLTVIKRPSKELLIDDLQQQKYSLTIPDLVKILEMLTQAEYSTDYLPNQLKNKRSKKKRKGLSNN
jgi:hypothetical protein